MYSAVDSGWRVAGGGWPFTVNRLPLTVYRLLLTVTCLLFLSGCAGVAPVVKVGLVGPFEGENRSVGYDVIYSARLAVREINNAGGIDGTRVSLVALDDSSDPELARQTAESLAIDPDVVAVVGHFRPETTAAAAEIYAATGVPLIAAGQPPFAAVPLATLPQTFRAAYDAVSPFDELPGPYSAAAYDAFNLLWLAMARAQANEGEITRNSVANALDGLEYEGLSGVVYWQVNN